LIIVNSGRMTICDYSPFLVMRRTVMWPTINKCTMVANLVPRKLVCRSNEDFRVQILAEDGKRYIGNIKKKKIVSAKLLFIYPYTHIHIYIYIYQHGRRGIGACPLLTRRRIRCGDGKSVLRNEVHGYALKIYIYIK